MVADRTRRMEIDSKLNLGWFLEEGERERETDNVQVSTEVEVRNENLVLLGNLRLESWRITGSIGIFIWRIIT